MNEFEIITTVIKQIYFQGLIRSFFILLFCRAPLTGSNKRAIPSLILGSIFRFTIIVPLSALIHFHDIRLIAEKKRQETIWKTSDKQNKKEQLNLN